MAINGVSLGRPSASDTTTHAERERPSSVIIIVHTENTYDRFAKPTG